MQDAHLHLQDPRLSNNLPSLIAEMQASGITHAVVNGTSPDDWPQVQKLAETYSNFITPSYGLHPWKTPTTDPDWKQKLTQLLDQNPKACIGECGLDRWMKDPNIPAQQEAFHFQLDLATQRNLPISIHILKAWGLLTETLKNHPTPERGFLLHSFGGSTETAHQLLDHGAYFSLSGYFLQPRKKAVLDTFLSLPLDRILIETDAPDMPLPTNLNTHPLPENINHPANLRSIYQTLADLKSITLPDLIQKISRNIDRFFKVN